MRAVAHIDEEGKRHQEPAGGHKVHEGEAVILVTEIMAAPTVTGSDEDEVSLPRDLSVGIPVIDEEHQRILAMIQRLQAAGQDRNRQVAQEVLLDLREYTVRHFKHEEALFRSADYPEADEHIAEHRNLTKKVDQLMNEGQHMHPDNLVHLLDVWVRDHIMDVDQRYVSCLTGQEAETVDSSRR
jgi:hemerythrin-like metal-binding protein